MKIGPSVASFAASLAALVVLISSHFGMDSAVAGALLACLARAGVDPAVGGALLVRVASAGPAAACGRALALAVAVAVAALVGASCARPRTRSLGPRLLPGVVQVLRAAGDLAGPFVVLAHAGLCSARSEALDRAARAAYLFSSQIRLGFAGVGLLLAVVRGARGRGLLDRILAFGVAALSLAAPEFVVDHWWAVNLAPFVLWWSRPGRAIRMAAYFAGPRVLQAGLSALGGGAVRVASSSPGGSVVVVAGVVAALRLVFALFLRGRCASAPSRSAVTVLGGLLALVARSAAQHRCASLVFVLGALAPCALAVPGDMPRGPPMWAAGMGREHFHEFWLAFSAFMAVQQMYVFAVGTPADLPDTWSSTMDALGVASADVFVTVQAQCWGWLRIAARDAPVSILKIIDDNRLKFVAACKAIFAECRAVGLGRRARLRAQIERAIQSVRSRRQLVATLEVLQGHYRDLDRLGHPVSDAHQLDDLLSLISRDGVHLEDIRNSVYRDSALQDPARLRQHLLDVVGPDDTPAAPGGVGGGTFVPDPTVATGPVAQVDGSSRAPEPIDALAEALLARLAPRLGAARLEAAAAAPAAQPRHECWRCGAAFTDFRKRSDHTRRCDAQPTCTRDGCGGSHLAQYHDAWVAARNNRSRRAGAAAAAAPPRPPVASSWADVDWNAFMPPRARPNASGGSADALEAVPGFDGLAGGAGAAAPAAPAAAPAPARAGWDVPFDFSNLDAPVVDPGPVRFRELTLRDVDRPFPSLGIGVGAAGAASPVGGSAPGVGAAGAAGAASRRCCAGSRPSPPGARPSSARAASTRC